jgi:acyl-ACP thioesterase
VTRRFASRRPIRLSDTDANGRLRLDAVARYLQDAASEDWLDAGFESSGSVWVVRRTELTVDAPFSVDSQVELETWCSGIAAAAASRRYSLSGDRGGRIEAESVWIHLDQELRPLRLPEKFREVFGPSADGHGVATRFTLPTPPVSAGEPWPLRRTDEDLLGHVNNAVYWVPLEEAFGAELRHAVLEYRKPLDVDEPAELVTTTDALWVVVGGDVRAAAAILRR